MVWWALTEMVWLFDHARCRAFEHGCGHRLMLSSTEALGGYKLSVEDLRVGAQDLAHGACPCLHGAYD